MIQIREFHPNDAVRVNELAVIAFDQFKDSYTDWPIFRSRIENMSLLAEVGEIIVAERQGIVVGAVAYVGPGRPKAEFFRLEWPIMRMLVVDPEARGHGISRKLAHECLDRAKRDEASIFALHTSELMKVALPMYERMGFKYWSPAPMIHGVKYGVYVKELNG